MASRAVVLLVLAAVLVALCAAAEVVSAQPAASPPLPSDKYRFIHPGRFKRNQEMTCDDPNDKTAKCLAKCDKRCPDECIVLCPGCKTYCMCDFYPGVSCGDPRFTGADGNNFYFHGKKDQNFCIVSDAGLHINAHFIGRRNPSMRRDFTWIQALGIRFGAGDHRLFIGAQKTVHWDSDVDRLELAIDGEPIDIPTDSGAVWRSDAAVPELTVTRTADVNRVRVRIDGVLDVVANAVPITKEESRVHGYGVTEDDSLAHLDIGFRFLGLTDDVHGVLGQTYRPDYVNRLSVSSNMPVMGGAPKYVSSDIFATDCAVARFGGAAAAAGISMVTTTARA